MLTLPSRPYPLLPNHKTALPILTSIPSLCPPSPHSSSEKLQAPPLLQGVLWLLILEMGVGGFRSWLFTIFLTRSSCVSWLQCPWAQGLAHIVFSCVCCRNTLIQQILVDHGGRDGWAGSEGASEDLSASFDVRFCSIQKVRRAWYVWAG